MKDESGSHALCCPCIAAGQIPEQVTEPGPWLPVPESCFVETRQDIPKVFDCDNIYSEGVVFEKNKSRPSFGDLTSFYCAS